MSVQVPSTDSRRNQYFIPGDGIARQVITADICKYLDNDALVRPGDYQVSPATPPRQSRTIQD